MAMDAARMKERAAQAALARIEPGMRLGIGTGSTAEAFVRQLAVRVSEGFEIVGVPLTSLDETPQLDVTVDGADEADASLRLIKGGGGALLREKIVAAASSRMIVIADASKLVRTLGAFALPIEVNGFGLTATSLAIGKAARSVGLSGELTLRRQGDTPFVTDGGHLLIDAAFAAIPDPQALSIALHGVPGVVEHGLFVGLATTLILAGENGVEEIEAP